MSPLKPRVIALALGLLLVTSFGLGACASAGSGGDPATSSPPAAKSGNQLWAENCARCHNNRSPSSYSDAQWEVVATHMRVRGNLTGPETEAILRFLQTAN
jgi:hypothetical protein